MVTTHYHVFPDEWDDTNHCFLFPENDFFRKKHLIEMNGEMQKDLKRLTAIVKKLERRGEYTIEDILRHFSLTPADNMVSSFTTKISEELTMSGHARMARAYRTVAKGLIEFNDGCDICLEQINDTFVRNYERYLKNTQKNVATVSFYMRNLRSIYNKAVHDEMIRPQCTYPFASVH